MITRKWATNSSKWHHLTNETKKVHRPTTACLARSPNLELPSRFSKDRTPAIGCESATRNHGQPEGNCGTCHIAAIVLTMAAVWVWLGRVTKMLKPRTYSFLLATFLAGTTVIAQSPRSLSTDDRSAIEALMTQYAQALSGCHAVEFADLFVPETGYFASGFRGRMVGRAQLIALVQSERQCVAPTGTAGAARAGGATGPKVALDVTASGVRGIANLGAAEYQDEYVKTPQGWRFGSRTVITAAEKAAGLDAREMLAIQRLGGVKLGDHYEAGPNGVPQLLTSGVKVGVSGDQITGRAYLKDGSYYDQVYERLSPGEWRVKSSTQVLEGTR
jgi:hypothetical protein